MAGNSYIFAVIHAPEDFAWVQEFMRALRRLLRQREPLSNMVWRTISQRDSEESLEKSFLEIAKRSNVLIVILSDSYLRSGWGRALLDAVVSPILLVAPRQIARDELPERLRDRIIFQLGASIGQPAFYRRVNEFGYLLSQAMKAPINSAPEITEPVPTSEAVSPIGELASAPVFISHSSKDRTVARKICSALEVRGLTCWVADRDVGLGENFQEAIVRAIHSAKAMVLVFTDNANSSREVQKELALASQHSVAVFPARLENIELSPALAYELVTRQWIDLFENWDDGIERLGRALARAR